jgi:hypothetical protein
MRIDGLRIDRIRSILVLAAGSIVILSALAFFFSRDQTYVHIDAIAHVNKARGLFDNFTPGLKQLGSIWLPLPHLLIAPLTWFDILWSTGLAGSLLSAACFVGTGCFLFGSAFRMTGVRVAGWLAFLFFAFNPRIIYLFTTPMTEPLMIFCAAGLGYFLICWIQSGRWQPLALAAAMMFGGTLTRYEGWAIAVAAVVIVFIAARRDRWVNTILFTGAACTGPMLWMLFNLVYFDDPLTFLFGRGSARDYALEYFFRTGKTFASAGSWRSSVSTYLIDIAYCLNPIVLWLALAGLVLLLVSREAGAWRLRFTLFVLALTPFGFYVYSLYSNTVPILLPGLVKDELDSIYNVRYGTVMAATLPIFAALAVNFVFARAGTQRPFAFLMLTPLILQPWDPIPERSQETVYAQFTENLFYREGVHNQSYWLPAFVEIGQRLKQEIDRTDDRTHLVLTNTRIIHAVVWRTAIPMRRFIHEMNKDRWNDNLNSVDPEIRWVITEEGDQLWHARGRFLREHFVEVASAKLPSTGTVHLYRRPD